MSKTAKVKWSAANPSPAAILMERLGAPTDYSSEGRSLISQVRRATVPTFRKSEARAANKRARIARRITQRYAR